MRQVSWCLSLLLSVAVLGLDVAFADANTAKYSIRLIGRKDVVVTTEQIRLRDVATVSSSKAGQDEIVIALQKIVIEKSPQPGKQVKIEAQKILRRLREEAVNLKQVGYMLPRSIVVERASRVLSMREVASAIEEFLGKADRDIALKEVHYRENVRILPGETELKVAPFNTSRPGQMGFNVVAKVPQAHPVHFTVKADIDEWKEVPVAKRSVVRGSVITPDDVTMARLNLQMLPRDAVLEAREIVGLEVDRDVAYGQAFRKSKLSQPPVIEAGTRVVMKYQGKLFDITATGVALEAGMQGEQIKVRNDASKKIIFGKAIEPGLVKVGP